MLKTLYPVPQEVQEWLCTLDDESLMQVARDAIAYASQALDKEPNAVVLEILESINDDPRELPPRRLPTVDEELAEQNRQFKASGSLLNQFAVMTSDTLIQAIQLVSQKVLAGASEQTIAMYTDLLSIGSGRWTAGRIVEADSPEWAIYKAGIETGLDLANQQEDLCASGHTV
jgi:hypothetical protein